VTAGLDAMSKKAGPEDDRTPAQRRHDALEEIFRRAIAAGDLPDTAGQPTQVLLHLTLDQLRSLDGAAGAEQAWAAGRAAGDGEPGWLSSRQAAEAYACDARIQPIVSGHVDPAALAAMTDSYLAGLSRPACTCGRCTCGGPAREPSPRTMRRLQDTLLAYAADVLSGPAGLASFLRTGLLAAEFPPAVSLPLDVGKVTHTVPPYQRRLVIARDRHCAAPGCRARPARCTGWAARRGPVPGAGPFPRSLPPNPAGAFQRTGLSGDYAAFAAGLAWMCSWQSAQTMSVLRRIFAMRAAHAGWPGSGCPR
jgi:hypothetical protein